MKIIAFVLLGLATPAAADGLDVPDHAGPIPDDTLRAEVGAGMVVGGFEAGSTGDVALGAEARFGLRYDRVVALVRGALLSLKEPGKGKHDSEDGYTVRGGADLRYSLSQSREVATTKHGRPVAIVRNDLWIGAGLGYESATWATGLGSHDHMPTSRSATRFSLTGGTNDRNHGTVDFALEFAAAHAPTSRTDSMLTGAIDHTVLFSMTFSTGS